MFQGYRGQGHRNSRAYFGNARCEVGLHPSQGGVQTHSHLRAIYLSNPPTSMVLGVGGNLRNQRKYTKTHEALSKLIVICLGKCMPVHFQHTMMVYNMTSHMSKVTTVFTIRCNTIA